MAPAWLSYVPIFGTLGVGTVIATFVGARLWSDVNAVKRCLEKLDKCKDAGVRGIRLSAAGDPTKAGSQEPFTLLSGLEDALAETFRRKPDYVSVQTALATFTQALQPADGFGDDAALAATVAADCERLDRARQGLRRVLLRIAEKNWVFHFVRGRFHGG